MDTQATTMCKACTHLNRDADGHTCEAFPEGIPEEIWENRHDHHNPYPGDNGVRFEIQAIHQNVGEKQRAK